MFLLQLQFRKKKLSIPSDQLNFLLTQSRGLHSKFNCMESNLPNDISENSSGVMAGHEIEDEESWVLVEKQVITILVPPPSPVHDQITSPRRIKNSSKKLRKRRLQTSSKKLKRNIGRQTKNHVVHLPEHGTQMEMDTANTLDVSHCSDPPAPGTTNFHGDSCRLAGVADNKNKFVEMDTANTLNVTHSQSPSSVPCHDVVPHAISNGNHALRNCTALKGSCFTNHPPVGAVEVVNFRLKAANIERQLKSSGGLTKWLVSLGLARFVGLFGKEKLNKYHLVNLTMGKLKEMGTDPVGPRRKLLHAIDCISQPYFQNPSQIA